MEAIELLRSRHSASKLGAPAPSAEAVEAMLEAAVHFGHKTPKWNPKMKKYIFGSRNT